MSLKQTLPKLRFASPTNPSFRFITEEAYSTSYSKSLMTRSKTTYDSEENGLGLKKKKLKYNESEKATESNKKKGKKLQALKLSDKSTLIGFGLHSSVYKIKIEKLSKTLALKVKRQYDDEKDRELFILRKLCGLDGHPNIIKLNHFFMSFHANESYLNMLTDYVPMNLKQFIGLFKTKYQELPALLIKVLAYQLFRAVAYMHELKIMHRGLSAENVLVDHRSFELKVCGFGSAKHFQRGEVRQSFSQVGTRQYRAPEQLLGSKSYNQSVDLWAVGCLLGEMQIQKVLFEGNNAEDVFSEIIKQLGTPTDEDLRQMQGMVNELKMPNIKPLSWDATLNLKPENALLLIIKQLVQYKPNARGNAFDYLLLPYFKELHKPNLKINGRPLPQLFNFSYDEMKQPKYKEHLPLLVPHWKLQVQIDQEDLQSMLTQP